MLTGGDTGIFLVSAFSESRAIAEAVERGAFWGVADASAALDALRFATFEQDVWGGGLLELWRHYVARRMRSIEAIGRRGLNRGAFRHARHARNALFKHQRQSAREGDFIESWQQEVERRIMASFKVA